MGSLRLADDYVYCSLFPLCFQLLVAMVIFLVITDSVWKTMTNVMESMTVEITVMNKTVVSVILPTNLLPVTVCSSFVNQFEAFLYVSCG